MNDVILISWCDFISELTKGSIFLHVHVYKHACTVCGHR